MRHDIMIRDDAKLPAGYRFGDLIALSPHTTYYVIRERDDAYCVAWLTRDDARDEDVTAEAIDDAIEARAAA